MLQMNMRNGHIKDVGGESEHYNQEDKFTL